jgi:hypothetical protein
LPARAGVAPRPTPRREGSLSGDPSSSLDAAEYDFDQGTGLIDKRLAASEVSEQVSDLLRVQRVE